MSARHNPPPTYDKPAAPPPPPKACKAAEPIEAVLDSPAQVGCVKFGTGIKWSTVIGAAQRHYAYRQEQKQIDAAAVQAIRDMLGIETDLEKLLKAVCQYFGKSLMRTPDGEYRILPVDGIDPDSASASASGSDEFDA